jgi:hypothetical protein
MVANKWCSHQLSHSSASATSPQYTFLLYFLERGRNHIQDASIKIDARQMTSIMVAGIYHSHIVMIANRVDEGSSSVEMISIIRKGGIPLIS